MRALRLASLVSFLLLCLAGPVAARGGMPSPLTPRGVIIEDIYYKIFVVAVIVFVFVMALLIWAIVHFRASSGNGQATFEHERDNLKLEMTWIVIPLFIMLWIGYISYAGLIQLDEGIAAEDADMELHIIGQKWFWTAEYDDFGVDAFYDALGNVNDGAEFYIPADKAILLNITGADVIHSFYIMDANQMAVGMVDANPTGPHKYNQMVIEFPAGEYHVQCKEMCFNPGHAYMRAKIISVPQAEYDSWYLDTLADLNEPKMSYAIEVTDGGVTTDSILMTAPKSAVRFQFANARATDVSFTALGQTIVAPAGGIGVLDLLPTEVGNVLITSDAGDELTLQVVNPEMVTVELGDFYISPSGFTLDAGKLYSITVNNVGGSPHNLFVGDYQSPDVTLVDWESDTINGGQSTTFLVLPNTAMLFDTWCNIPGHAGAGMLASMTAA